MAVDVAVAVAHISCFRHGCALNESIGCHTLRSLFYGNCQIIHNICWMHAPARRCQCLHSDAADTTHSIVNRASLVDTYIGAFRSPSRKRSSSPALARARARARARAPVHQALPKPLPFRTTHSIHCIVHTTHSTN